MVKVAGILSGVQRKVTKQGNPWAAATLEDLAGAIEVLFFPATYQLYATSIAEDAIVVVKGRIDRRDDVPKLDRDGRDRPGPDGRRGGPFVVSLPVTRCVPPVVEQLKEVLMTHPGPTEVHLQAARRPSGRRWCGSTTSCGSPPRPRCWETSSSCSAPPASAARLPASACPGACLAGGRRLGLTRPRRIDPGDARLR